MREGVQVRVVKPTPRQKYQTCLGAEGVVLGRADGMWMVAMQDTGHVLLFRAAELRKVHDA